jgi:hypothetical protein
MKKNHTKLHHLSNQTIISLIVLLVVGKMQINTLLMDVNLFGTRIEIEMGGAARHSIEQCHWRTS